MRDMLVALGQKVSFDPFGDMCNFYGAEYLRGKTVEGTVDFINEKGRWFSVVYDGQRTSFSYTDIGKKVRL